jgi:hypothetical protein
LYYLTKAEVVFFTRKLKAATDKNDNPPWYSRGLAINGGNVMLTFMEWEVGKLERNIMSFFYLLAFEDHCRGRDVQINQIGHVVFKHVIVMINKCLGHLI